MLKGEKKRNGKERCCMKEEGGLPLSIGKKDENRIQKLWMLKVSIPHMSLE